MTSEYNEYNEYYILKCPSCDENVLIHKNELNCRIFRHAVYKHNMQPIPPHLGKPECDNLVSSGTIYGCAKPFRVEGDGESINAVLCDYI